MTHGKMVITAQVETFNNLNQYNLIIKCRWPKLCTFVQKFPTVTERQNFVLGSVRLIGGIKKRQPKRLSFFMVPVAGLEPARYRYRWILSPLRLPIPSHRHKLLNHSITTILFLQLIQQLFTNYFAASAALFLASSIIFALRVDGTSSQRLKLILKRPRPCVMLLRSVA